MYHIRLYFNLHSFFFNFIICLTTFDDAINKNFLKKTNDPYLYRERDFFSFCIVLFVTKKNCAGSQGDLK